ncbi:hypothetical protein VTK26DRAFT_1618 [Humicola hyalothermophila]
MDSRDHQDGRHSLAGSPATPSTFRLSSVQIAPLSLREERDTIQRLSNANFDLKLRVMFLTERLNELSDDNVKDVIKENVDLKIQLGILRRENRTQRRQIKQLQQKLQTEDSTDQRPGTGKSTNSDEDADALSAHETHEIVCLREQLQEHTIEIERLKKELADKESDKRRMTETVRQLVDEAGHGSNVERREVTEVLKDLLDQETARREHADQDNRRLHDDIFRLKQELASARASCNQSHPTSSTEPADNTSTATLVEELRRQSEQLRHENAELRREVGAQTSMLTSRNREKERLYSEIEELKLAQRSASRAFDRPQSRDSSVARAPDPSVHEQCENRIADLQDKNHALRLQNQDLQCELEKCMDDFEKLVTDKKRVEEQCNAALNDVMVLQAERDEALQEHAALETAFEDLRKEAQEEISLLEADVQRTNAEMDGLRLDLRDCNDNFEALQREMRSVSDMLVAFENDQSAKQDRIQQLEQELADANKDIEGLEAQLRESNDTCTRLSVQLENSQNEVAFLREEQEGDKIRIGDLQATLAKTDVALQECQEERNASNQLVDELKQRVSASAAESRKLRKSLADQQGEATKLKETLDEFTNKLGVALGVVRGTRSSLIDTVSELRRSSDESSRELDTTKSALAEKVRLLKQRDELLESHALESRKVAELLEKERQSHRNTKNELETFQRTHQHVSHTVTTKDTRISELEAARAQDKKRLSILEKQLKDELTERNKLLLKLWTRLASLCGTDWAHNNSLINGRALPSVESVATMLPGFSQNLMAAVKHLETTFNGFASKIKSVERDLWKEYQTLENHLDSRIKKMDRLEGIVRNNVATGAVGGPALTEALARLEKLEQVSRQLRVENHTLRAAAQARASRGTRDSPDKSSGTALVSPTSPGSPSRPAPTDRKGKGVASTGASSTGASSTGASSTGASLPSRIPQAGIHVRKSSSPTNEDAASATLPSRIPQAGIHTRKSSSPTNEDAAGAAPPSRIPQARIHTREPSSPPNEIPCTGPAMVKV